MHASLCCAVDVMNENAQKTGKALQQHPGTGNTIKGFPLKEKNK